MTSTALPPVQTPLDLCSCEKPAPRQQATHKGAATTICENCSKPVRLSFWAS